MDFATIDVVRDGQGAVRITLNRPDRLNAFNDAMLRELDECARALNDDPTVRTVTLAGAGGNFCAGRDTAELSDVGRRDSGRPIPASGGHESSMFRALEMPTIALLDGAVVGGGLGFALQCDLRIATDRVKLYDGHLRNGMAPSVAAWYLPRLTGIGAALRFCAHDRPVPVEELTALGLVDAHRPAGPAGSRARPARRAFPRRRSAPSAAHQGAAAGSAERGIRRHDEAGRSRPRVGAAGEDVVTDWDAFFEPRVVAVVGASGDPRRIGGRLVRYSLESGFAGRIIPVNPNRAEVFGLPTKASLADVDEAPDWVVVALPRDRVAAAVEEAGRLGARNVSVVAAGFAETDDAGRDLQRSIAEIAGRYGMRLLGPNSNGFMNVASGAYFAFTPVIDSARPSPGDFAIVTQSAAIGTYLVNWCRRIGLGVRHWFHTGNEADVTALEVVRVLAERGQVRAVALSFETLRDMEDLHDTLRTLAQAGIATAVLQAGTSTIGRLASQAHTAALIGAENDLLGDLVASAGGYPAASVAGLVNFVQVAVDHPRLTAAPRLGFVSTSGGVGVLMADAAEASGIAMPTLSGPTQARIRAVAPFSHPANPVDTTAQVINEPEAFPRILSECVDSGEVDLLGVFIAHGLAGPEDRTLRHLAELARARPDASFAGLGILSEEAAAALRAAGVSVFSEPIDLTVALRASVDAAAARATFARRDAVARRSRDADVRTRRSCSTRLHGKRLLRGRGRHRGRRWHRLRRRGGRDAREGVRLPGRAQAGQPRLPHKAARGGVHLDLWTDDAVRAAYADLDALGRRETPERYTVLVERQLTGTELFVARVRHPRLGVLVGIGPGGGDVESAGAVRWQWGPVGVAEVRGAAGVRLGEAHAAAVAALVGAMATVGASTVEANPVFLTGDGAAVVADALIEIDPGGPR